MWFFLKNKKIEKLDAAIVDLQTKVKKLDKAIVDFQMMNICEHRYDGEIEMCWYSLPGRMEGKYELACAKCGYKKVVSENEAKAYEIEQKNKKIKDLNDQIKKIKNNMSQEGEKK